MEKQELKALADYLDKLADTIPNGLWALKDAVSFACIEIRMFLRFNKKGADFDKALKFAKSIPKHEDLNHDEIIKWQLYDKQYLEYMP